MLLYSRALRYKKTFASANVDLFEIIQHFSDYPGVNFMHSYQLSVRVLKMQCHIEKISDGKPLEISVKTLH